MLEDKPRTLAYREAILSNKELFKGKTVLDVGAGTGRPNLFNKYFFVINYVYCNLFNVKTISKTKKKFLNNKQPYVLMKFIITLT